MAISSVTTSGAIAGISRARGFRSGVAAGDVRGDGSGRNDVTVIASDLPASAAGVFTRNLVRAAPVVLSEAVISTSRPVRAVVVNSGNANACTGEQGYHDAEATARTAAAALGVIANEILVCSTGVIGRPMPVAKLDAAVQRASVHLDDSDDLASAEAIMTTDTVPKRASVEVSTAAGSFRIGGMAKGAGMIHPDMATLIVVLTTDAAVTVDDLQAALREVIDDTFNCVTVDGDTSTNDTALLLANGAAGLTVSPSDDPTWKEFVSALDAVCTSLSEQVAADAEGATRYFRVAVSAAASVADARAVARTVAGSPLVKTAIHGADPNWGRIIAAAGRAGAAFDPANATVTIGAIPVFVDGEPTTADLDAIAECFRADAIEIGIDLGAGDAAGRAWGCDLSAEYVSINADYTT